MTDTYVIELDGDTSYLEDETALEEEELETWPWVDDARCALWSTTFPTEQQAVDHAAFCVRDLIEENARDVRRVRVVKWSDGADDGQQILSLHVPSIAFWHERMRRNERMRRKAGAR